MNSAKSIGAEPEVWGATVTLDVEFTMPPGTSAEEVARKRAELGQAMCEAVLARDEVVGVEGAAY